MVRIARAVDPALRALLSAHPRTALDPEDAPGEAPLEFHQDGWRRRVWVGARGAALFGLPELADNNPWVCADEVALPDALGTLALVCFGPLARAGLIVEAPVLQTNCAGPESGAHQALESAGWSGGVFVAYEPFLDDPEVFAATGLAVVRTPERPEDLDDLFEEAFGRSFFVRRDEASPWDLGLVLGTPRAVYRLRYTPGEDTGLLTIQAMAARDGKCGAAQIVHAMNVMAGLEETLGTEARASTGTRP